MNETAPCTSLTPRDTDLEGIARLDEAGKGRVISAVPDDRRVLTESVVDPGPGDRKLQGHRSADNDRGKVRCLYC